MATAEDVARMIVALSAAYRAEVDKAQVEIWGLAVKSIDADVLFEATESWIKTSPKFPRPAEIIQTAQIIVRRRRDRTPALPEPELPEGQLIGMRREGLGQARRALKEAQGRDGVVKHVDDVIEGKGTE